MMEHVVKMSEEAVEAVVVAHQLLMGTASLIFQTLF